MLKIIAMQSGLIFEDISLIFLNKDLMENLMDYIMPWSNLIFATIEEF